MGRLRPGRRVVEIVQRDLVLRPGDRGPVFWECTTEPWHLTPGELPPDLTAGGRDACGVVLPRWRDSWTCTRRAGHTGRHASGDGQVIRAVWRRGVTL